MKRFLLPLLCLLLCGAMLSCATVPPISFTGEERDVKSYIAIPDSEDATETEDESQGGQGAQDPGESSEKPGGTEIKTGSQGTSQGTSQGASSPSGGETSESSSPFYAGFARQSITPASPIPLGGYGNSAFRISTRVLDDIEATCIAMSDGTNTVLLFTLDALRLSAGTGKKAATLIEARTGVPAANILFCCTHSHSTPDEGNTADSVTNWKASLLIALTETAAKAVEDRARAEIYCGSARASGMTFVRHYLLANGNYKGDNFNADDVSPIVGHESEADNELQILEFRRSGRKNIILANFQSHPALTGGNSETNISSDYVGAFRKAAERETGAMCAFFQGAAGNLNPKSRIDGESISGDYLAYGETLARVLWDSIDALTKVETGKVAMISNTVSAEINHSKDSLKDQAQQIADRISVNDRAGATALCRQYGFSSFLAASALLSRQKLGARQDVSLFAISIGEVAFIGAPYEMFDTNGMNVKRNSPYTMTFVCELAGGTNSYVPSALAYQHGCYEADVSRFAAGTGEIFQDQFIHMLNSLHS